MALLADGGRRSTAGRWREVADAGRHGLSLGSILLAFVCFLQAPGRLVPDSKFDLVIDPGQFLSRALHLWEPTAQFGFLQNQAVGYLFPIGPFFWLGSFLHVPGWIIQRSWLSLLFVAAFVGFVRMMTIMKIGTPRARLLGGLLFALSPAFLTLVGTTSLALLGGVCTPWIIGTLARWAEHPRRAVMRAAVPVLFIGGTNATSTLAALILPTIFILFQNRRVRWRLLAWWPVAVVLATLWWAVPLVFQGRYGFDFLPYTERATTTVSTASAVEMLRGTSSWLGYLGINEPWSRAADMLVHNPIVVGATVLVALAGLLGLIRSNMPHRRMFGAAFVVGAVLIGSGYAGASSGPLARSLRTFLDGPLGFARNVSKFDPTLRIVLLAGVVQMLSTVRLLSTVRGATRPRPRLVGAIAVIAAVAVASASVWPALIGRMAPSGSFSAVPSYWKDVAKYLRANGGDARSLLVPTSAFAEYTWGRPLDEPLQGYGLAPWATRNLIPFGGPDDIRMLDGIEDVLATGQGSPGLPETLRRDGVRFVVVRNDLDWRRSRSPRPIVVRTALTRSGLTSVAQFGRVAKPKIADPITDLGLSTTEAGFPAVEIYSSGRQTARATAYPLDATVVVSGAAESIGQLANRNLLDGRAAVLARDAPRDLASGWAHLVTDTGVRQNTTFGLVRDNESYVLQPGENAAGFGRTRQFGTDPGDGAATNRQSTATMRGVAAVTASSYGSWLLALPEVAPWKALDGDSSTAWVAEHTRDGTPELRITLDAPATVDHLDITPLADGPWRLLTRAVTVRTDTGSVRTALTPTEQPQRVAVPAGTTRVVVVALDAERDGDDPGRAGPGLREVTLPGVDASRGVHTPADAGSLAAPPTIAFDRWRATPEDLLRRDPETTLDRTFDAPAATYKVTGTVVPRPGPALEAFLNGLAARNANATKLLTVSASSWWLDLPANRPENLFDDNPNTVWLAKPAAPPRLINDRATVKPGTGAETSPLPADLDPNPTVTVSWPEERTLDSVEVAVSDLIGSPPKALHITSVTGERTVTITNDPGTTGPGAIGRGTFEPLRTNKIQISFPELETRTVPSGLGDHPTIDVPVGFVGLKFPALADLAVPTLNGANVVSIGCANGPTIDVDGNTYRLFASGTIDDFLQLRPLKAGVCEGPSSLPLAAGEHHIVGKPSEAFSAASLTLAPAPLAAPAVGRDVATTRWGRSSRTLSIGAGSEQILTVHENANRGWRAELNGTRLRSITVDGWQQGYIVPAGDAGTVTLTFTPDRAYRLSLLVGLIAALVLVAFALVGRRAPSTLDRAFDDGSSFALASTLDDVAPTSSRPEWHDLVIPIAAAAIVGTLLSAFAGLVAAAIVFALIRRTRLAPWAVAVPCVAAGVVAVARVAKAQPGTGTGSFSGVAQILAAIAIAVAAGACLRAMPRLARGDVPFGEGVDPTSATIGPAPPPAPEPPIAGSEAETLALASLPARPEHEVVDVPVGGATNAVVTTAGVLGP